MTADNDSHSGSTLRHVLRSRTHTLHARLDTAIGSTAISDGVGYAVFLGIQYATRAPIERWARDHLPPELAMPATAPLIAADLVSLNAPLPPEVTFVCPVDADPLGVAWALGGSALGNKAMLSARRRAGFRNAEMFLSDESLLAYFRALLPQLARPAAEVSTNAAVAGATAVFGTFLSAVACSRLRTAA